MSKPVKQMVMDELRGRYADIASACVVELSGLSVQSQQALRQALRAKGARLEVVKNSLARKAFAETKLAPLGAALSGPCALVVSSESVIDTARTLVACAKEFERLKLKQAIFEGDPSLVTVEELSKMKGRAEVLGDLAWLVMSPARAVAGCLASPQSKIAGCLKAMAEKAAA